MHGPDGRTMRRTILGSWLAAGALALGHAVLASGCTPATPALDDGAPAAEIDGVDKAEQAWRAEIVAGNEPIWNEESAPDGDPFSAGLAAYRLASATRDPAWSRRAADAFDEVLASDPGFTLARAWRGSARALMARDHPFKGLWQIVPGPGFVRLHHVRAAFTDLDAAVAAAPHDPLVRLVRASTYLAMPAVFGRGDDGIADFEKLHAWIRNPGGNPDHAHVLRSPMWREEYLLSRSRAMAAFGDDEDAARSWRRLSETTGNPTLQELAKWHLISIGASR